MRIPKLLAGIGLAALILSVAANYILYHRIERLRPQLTVNGKTFTKRDYHDWLENHYGVQAQADIAKNYLVTQAAEKAGMNPDQKEVDKDLADMQDASPQLSATFRVEPWKKDDLRREIETSLALTALASKDVKATDEDIKTFFAAQGAKYDTPIKLDTRVIVCRNADTAGKIKDTLKQMLDRSHGDPKAVLPDLSLLVQNYLPNANFPLIPVDRGGDGRVVLQKPYSAPSQDPVVNSVAMMNKGEVKDIPGPQGRSYVVLLVDKTDGKRGTLDDPEVRKRVERDFKATRATPPQEVLRGLWDSANIQTDPPVVKKAIEAQLFPERVNQPATRQASATP